MTGFLGEYESTLDPKGRFLLPSALKKQIAEGENRFVINRGFEKCLNLYPSKIWENIITERISKLNDFDPKVRQFKLFFLGGATEVELDTANRILLPPSLKEFAGLSKDIVLASNLNNIHIWDAGKYKQFFEDFSSENYSKLANEVLGSESAFGNLL